QVSLVEAGRGLRAPGDPVLLSCHRAGFTFDNYYVRWYHQAPVTRLEWVSWISHYSSQMEFGPAVQGRANASRNNAWSEAALSLHRLHHGDSALYFCAACTVTGIPLSFNTK
ncbi:HVM57 protein, partial [Ceuthmochares aereus]|nr:HVM57 protein [Ceuthmochares aereus]